MDSISSPQMSFEKLVDPFCVGDADEVAAIRDDLVRPDTADRDQMVPGSVDVKYRAARPGGGLPPEDHSSLPTQNRNRRVAAHIPD